MTKKVIIDILIPESRLDRFSRLTRQSTLFLFLIISYYVHSQDSRIGIETEPGSLFNQAYNMRFQNPDSATTLFLLAIEESKNKRDTFQTVLSLVNLSQHYAQNGNFLPAYEGYWEALALADQSGDSLAISRVYEGLGWQYSLFGRFETGKQYFEANVRVLKKLVENNLQPREALLSGYYGLAVMHRNAYKNELARAYIDTCNQVREQSLLNEAYVNSELGFVLGNEGDFDGSLKVLNKYRPFFEENIPSYLVIFDSYLGGIYKSKGQYERSEYYYLNSLKAGEIHKSHQDLIPDIYQSLGDLYSKMNQPIKAYDYLAKSKYLEQSQFGTQSESNIQIMEITDKYRLEKENRLREMERQRITKLEQQAEIDSLKSLILYMAVGFLLALIFVIYRFLRSRYKAQKAVIEKEKELEISKARELVEFKNKELTASTLQLIQRDELLTELRDKLKEQKTETNGREIGRLVSHIDINKSHNWDEFNARFISVNSKFYENLKDRFPSLSSGDKKICALIKLNFSSKDMSRLLGISVESVHTTRYRLRKKLNLERQDNLEDFVAAI